MAIICCTGSQSPQKIELKSGDSLAQTEGHYSQFRMVQIK